MIVHCNGDMIKCTGQGILTHSVNCHGVMASGIPKQMKENFTEVQKKYVEFCKGKVANELLGQILYVKTNDGRLVANCFGQSDYGYNGFRYTSYDALDKIFLNMSEQIREETPIHLPFGMSSVLGGGTWSIVESIIKAHLSDHSVTIWKL